MGWEFPPEGASPVWLFGAKAAGRVALVDDADYDLVRQYTWNIHEVVRPDASVRTGPYAVTNITDDGRPTTLQMHRLLTGWPMTDHKNHDGLDNRRANLRETTHSLNAANSRPRRDKKASRYKGVSYLAKNGKFIARIRVSGVTRYLGMHVSEIDAALAYDAEALKAFGEHAYINFPAEQVSA